MATDAQKNEIIKLYRKEVPTRQIAIRLGLTAGQVSGIIHRHNHPDGAKKYTESRAARKLARASGTTESPAEARSESQATVVAAPVPALAPVPSRRALTTTVDGIPSMPRAPVGEIVSLLDLTMDHCRNVVRIDGGIPMYCGHQTVEGTSWCKHHKSRYMIPHNRPHRRKKRAVFTW